MVPGGQVRGVSSTPRGVELIPAGPLVLSQGVELGVYGFTTTIQLDPQGGGAAGLWPHSEAPGGQLDPLGVDKGSRGSS